jgi:translation elongation factor EF-1alpha
VSKLVQNAIYIPCSGLSGDNFVDLSPKSPWYARRFGSAGGTIPESGTLLAAIDQMSSSQ